MANEISLSAALAASKGGIAVTQSLSATDDMVGTDMITTTQYINTTNTALDIGAITSPPRFLLIKNLDTANDVCISPDPGFAANTISLRIPPLRFNLISPQQALHAKANVAVCQISITAVEA